jgi:hypothetical protein
MWTTELPPVICSRLIVRSPIFDMLPSRCLPPVECWRGARLSIDRIVLVPLHDRLSERWPISRTSCPIARSSRAQ